MKKNGICYFRKKGIWAQKHRGPKWYISQILRVSRRETCEIDGCTKKVQIQSSDKEKENLRNVTHNYACEHIHDYI